MDLTYLKTLLGFVSNRTHDTTTSILAYWEVLEYFQELSFPQASKSGLPEDEVRVRYVRSEDELKYFIYAPYRDADSFRLYVGGVPKYDLLSELYRLIPADKDNERFRKLLEKNKSVSVLYTIDLSPSGEYIEGSFQLSPYIWAISCLIHDREVDEEWLEELLEDGNDFFMTIEDEEGIEFFSLLRQKTVELLDRLRIRSLFTVNDGFRRNDLERVCARALKSDDTDLSISFYAKDLSRVRKSLLDKRPNRLLVNYINAPLMSGGNRQSICSIENYRKWLGPERYPLGRWPSEFSPALMQQMAINIALAEENAGGCGIFSVNGPPGTGKTTLLKDIIAEYVVRRARLLADLNQPDDAFTETPLLVKSLGAGKSQKTFGLQTGRGLADYGILVTSCNNTAVENITFELPETSKLPTAEAMSKAGHSLVFSEGKDLFFGDLASNMLNGNTDPGKHTKQAWGLISARLGKGDNIRSFSEMVLRPFVSKMSPKRDNEKVMREFKNRFPSFDIAQQEFLKQYRIVERLRRSVSCNEEVFRMADEKMQSSNPLKNAEFDKAREDLFYQALVLHGSFVINSYKWRCNLYSLLAFWDNKYMPEEKELIFSHVLNSLFFLVPVVSTTFASVQKMLEYMGREQLGLLIVDEAGQAAPQCAVGALWRAKKAIIVGDPKQVEPVVTTDETLMTLYQKKCGIVSLSSYLSKSHSVQGFADLINRYGSWIGETWVGCPLVVHRRCINPMFSISNRVSYDDTMILGMKDAVKDEEKSQLLLDHSLWIDVPGKKGTSAKGNNDHYVAEQGEVCLRLILAWMGKHREKEDTRKLYVISPFTTVVKGIKAAVKAVLNTEEYSGLKGKFKGWETANCGTVHKFQGKEAEEVIFLLGCQPSSTGAIGWVNSNILNVAVTRAKKRVYFIGDYEVWSRQNRNFSPEIICFSEEDTGLQRIHFSELPDFGEIEAMEETPDLEFPGAEDSQVEYLLEEDEIDPETTEPEDRKQDIRPIPRYSFLTGPEYHHRYRVIYSHPYQLIFEVLMTDPTETLPDLPVSFYRKLSDSPSLWMCLIYPVALDFPAQELENEFDQVIDWYNSL